MWKHGTSRGEASSMPHNAGTREICEATEPEGMPIVEMQTGVMQKSAGSSSSNKNQMLAEATQGDACRMQYQKVQHGSTCTGSHTSTLPPQKTPWQDTSHKEDLPMRS